ncbi:class I SAM-dependent methyltransferase [Streptomyces halobius]|uniref:Class I SAM-dependent methyltransferase n=1 Tax=Streptomyces halobius TaxID=2879846 RepID=A0ABY4M4L5_9ACTN|nr:class I SAM-dependent methyltransferase [Streptomyces halobius]UQA92208.1 class I SAM-dependent methyltransferase [Streptomyces halobius]
MSDHDNPGQRHLSDHGIGDHTTHDHITHIDWAVLGPLLEQGAEVQAPFFEAAAAWLRELLTDADAPEAAATADAGPDGPRTGPRTGPRPHPVRRILDVGSGPGVTTCLLAQAFPDAEAVAVDATEALLARTRDRAARLGLGDRVRTHLAELPGGLDALDGADLIWSSKALHHVGDQRGAVAALAGHLRPGGLLAVFEGGLNPRFLPRDIGIGRPGLQSRLDAVGEEAFTEMRAALPDAVDAVEDWPAFLADAGLRTPRTRSFLLDLPAPLSAEAREHLRATLLRSVEVYGDRLDEDDRTTLGRLTDPDDPAGITRRPDAFLLSAQTVHTARAQ